MGRPIWLKILGTLRRNDRCVDHSALHLNTCIMRPLILNETISLCIPGKGGYRTPVDQNHSVVAHLEKSFWSEGVLIKTKSNSTKQSERLTVSYFVAAAFRWSGGAFRKAVHIKHKRQAFIYVTHSLLVGNVQLFARGWVASGVQKEFDVLWFSNDTAVLAIAPRRGRIKHRWST